MDELASINRSIQAGDWQAAYDEWLSIQPSLSLLNQEGYILPTDVKKEIDAIL